MLKKYEGLFIFAASLKDEALEKAFATIQAEIEKNGGKVLDSERLGVRTFARPMKKKDTGLYARLKLELNPESISALQARFKLNEEIFRVQITSGISKKKEEPEAAKPASEKPVAEKPAVKKPAVAPAAEEKPVTETVGKDKDDGKLQ